MIYSPESFVKYKDLPNLNTMFGNIGQSWTNPLPNDLFIKSVPKNILNSFAKTGNVGTGLDPLRSFTFPAKSLAKNGDLFHAWLGGAFGINDDDKRIQLSFGGNVLLNTALIDLDNFGWYLDLLIVRASNTTFNYILGLNLGQLLTTSAAVVSSTGQLIATRTGDAVTLSGGTTFTGNNQTLLLEAESATATNDNIFHNVAKIELTRF